MKRRKKPTILVSPGPVQVPIFADSGLFQMHHRSESFEALMRECDEISREALGTKSPVSFLACSGTGAMEAVVATVVPPRRKFLVISGGKFGDRWAEIARAYS